MSVKRRIAQLERNRPNRVVYVLLEDETEEDALLRAQKEWPGANVRLSEYVLRLPRPLSEEEWEREYGTKESAYST